MFIVNIACIDRKTVYNLLTCVLILSEPNVNCYAIIHFLPIFFFKPFVHACCTHFSAVTAVLTKKLFVERTPWKNDPVNFFPFSYQFLGAISLAVMTGATTVSQLLSYRRNLIYLHVGKEVK